MSLRQAEDSVLSRKIISGIAIKKTTGIPGIVVGPAAKKTIVPKEERSSYLTYKGESVPESFRLPKISTGKITKESLRIPGVKKRKLIGKVVGINGEENGGNARNGNGGNGNGGIEPGSVLDEILRVKRELRQLAENLTGGETSIGGSAGEIIGGGSGGGGEDGLEVPGVGQVSVKNIVLIILAAGAVIYFLKRKK
jgi:hypothetical protein